eukprot:9481901-Pyramimonas_sp.AAC.1
MPSMALAPFLRTLRRNLSLRRRKTRSRDGFWACTRTSSRDALGSGGLGRSGLSAARKASRYFPSARATVLTGSVHNTAWHKKREQHKATAYLILVCFGRSCNPKTVLLSGPRTAA